MCPASQIDHDSGEKSRVVKEQDAGRLIIEGTVQERKEKPCMPKSKTMKWPENENFRRWVKVGQKV
jgi:hypothetical protein